MNIYYKKFDKIVLKDTGEVFTVYEDSGHVEAPSIIVYENIGRRIMRWEVRPAGETRLRFEASVGITEPDPVQPPPLNRWIFNQGT